MRSEVNGFYRAHLHASWIFAVHAGYSEVFDDFFSRMLKSFQMVPLHTGRNLVFFFTSDEAGVACLLYTSDAADD